ncbi:MAG: hypothetical protein JEZ08_16685 [Clostridiales bacterium]|nr:hypothetical protein [Clostridiales bacterium]
MLRQPNSTYSDYEKDVDRLIKIKENLIIREKKSKFQPLFALVVFAITSVITALFVLDWTDLQTQHVATTIMFGILGVGVYVVFLTIFKSYIEAKIRKVTLEQSQYGVLELKEIDSSDNQNEVISKLIKINFKYLDSYYEQTREQASKSFLFTVIASFIGLTTIIAGIIMVYNNRTEPGYVAAVTGTIVEFISAIFFYLYNQTISKMTEYHKKLVITQNISLAMKLSSDLSDEKAKQETQTEIIKELVKDVNVHIYSS